MSATHAKITDPANGLPSGSMAPPAEEPREEPKPRPARDEPRSTRTANPELAAMAKIDRILSEDLPTDASRARVVRWLTGYYAAMPALDLNDPRM